MTRPPKPKLKAAREPLHPEGRALTVFERQLWKLRLVGFEAQLILQAVRHPLKERAGPRLLSQEMYYVVIHYGIIVVKKFSEVWEPFAELAQQARPGAELIAAVQPMLDRLAIWPDLKQYRDQVVAHAYAAEDHTSLVFPWELRASPKTILSAPAS